MVDYSEDELDRLFYALSDSTRRRLLLLLSEGEQRVTDLARAVGASKQVASKHLVVLETARLISKVRDGRVRRCCFNPLALDPLQEVISRYRQFWEERFDSLENYIEAIQKQGEQND